MTQQLLYMMNCRETYRIQCLLENMLHTLVSEEAIERVSLWRSRWARAWCDFVLLHVRQKLVGNLSQNFFSESCLTQHHVTATEEVIKWHKLLKIKQEK
jgi:hypothetical protein